MRRWSQPLSNAGAIESKAAWVAWVGGIWGSAGHWVLADEAVEI